MRRIKISPVRENASENCRVPRKRRSQVLGSILYWAHDAGACRIEFNPNYSQPFTYFASTGDRVTSELGDPPSDRVDQVAQLVSETIGGHPLLRPLRKLLHRSKKADIVAQIEIPPTNIYSGSTWICAMIGDRATFHKQAVSKPIGSAG